MSDEPRSTRRPAPQRPPGELAELLAAMSDETQPRTRVRRPAQPSRAVSPRPSQTAPPRATQPPAASSPPRPSEPAPRVERPSPQPPSQAGVTPDEPTPAPAVPESDVVAGIPVSAGTLEPESFVEDADADASPATSGARARSRTSGRVGQRHSRGRAPSRISRSARPGRPPAGRGLEAPRVRSRGQQRLRLVLVGGGLLIVAIVLLAVLGSSGSTHHPAASQATTPLPAQSSATVPPPRTITPTTRTAATTTRRTTPPPAAATTLPGAAHDVLLIPRLLPGPSGARTIAAARASLVVIDPDNGPGHHPVKALRAQITAVRHAGGRPLAYVATARGRRSAHAVLAEMGRYRRWYGVRDLYLAGAATRAGALGYYRSLARDARSHGARLVVLDPGAVPAPGYFAVANVIVTFAGSYRSYLGVRFPHSLATIAADRQANLVAGAATASQAHRALGLARRRGVGLAFVSSGSGPRALDAVPAYVGRERGWLAGADHSR